MKKIIAMSVLWLLLTVAAAFAAQPDLKLNGMSFCCSDRSIGDVYEVSAQIVNLKAVDASTFKIKFLITPSTYSLVQGYTLEQTVTSLGAGGTTMATVKFVPEEKGTYNIKAVADSGNNISEVDENNNEYSTAFSVGETAYVATVPTAEPSPYAKELREVRISAATPEKCGVPAKFRDKTDTAVLMMWSAVEEENKWAHGKYYGKLYLAGGYWVTLHSAQGDTATISVDGQKTTMSKGQSKELNSVVIYLYDVGRDYIDYCIHETEQQYLKLTCAGCVADSRCLPIGTRLLIENNPSYCDIDKEMINQEGEDQTCQNNYECASNLCIDNRCVSPGLLTRILQWFKNLFS